MVTGAVAVTGVAWGGKQMLLQSIWNMDRLGCSASGQRPPLAWVGVSVSSLAPNISTLDVIVVIASSSTRAWWHGLLHIVLLLRRGGYVTPPVPGVYRQVCENAHEGTRK